MKLNILFQKERGPTRILFVVWKIHKIHKRAKIHKTTVKVIFFYKNEAAVNIANNLFVACTLACSRVRREAAAEMEPSTFINTIHCSWIRTVMSQVSLKPLASLNAIPNSLPRLTSGRPPVTLWPWENREKGSRVAEFKK